MKRLWNHGRHWLPSRQAYSPRFVSAMAPAVVIVLASNLVFDMTGYEALASSIAIAIICGNVRWAMWRWRHPVLTLEQRLQMLHDNRQSNGGV